ncbi:MAG: hypothetical protein AAFZ11_09020 [Pseudomonadota bacterium]
MAFTDRPSTEKALGVVFLVFIMGWAIRFIDAGGIIEYWRPEKRIENEIAAALAKEPGGEVVLRRLESEFPNAHDEFLRTLRNRALQDESGARVGATAVTWIRGFFAGHENDFGYAPLPKLDAVIEFESAFVSKLAVSDVTLCDAYAVGLPFESAPSEAIKALGAKATEARFDAIQAGRQDQQTRFWLVESDWKKVSEAYAAKGVSVDQIEFMAGDLNGAVLEEGQACEALQLYLETIADQPDERRALLIGAYASQE